MFKMRKKDGGSDSEIYPSESLRTQRFLPTFTLDDNDLPNIKNWEVGKKYTLRIEVELVSTSKNEYQDKTPLRSTFKIHKVGAEQVDEAEMMAKKGHY